jgi:predicted ester cyclase
MSAQNKAAMRRIFEEIWTQGNFEVANEILSPDYIGHFLPPGAPTGREGFCWYIQMYRTAIPDLYAQVDDMVAEGDKVVSRVTFRGTHTGPLMHIPPTGKEVTVTAMVMTRFENGQNVEAWGESDRFGLMQQLGVIPAPQPA